MIGDQIVIGNFQKTKLKFALFKKGSLYKFIKNLELKKNSKI